jgi:hypothetical protein
MMKTFRFTGSRIVEETFLIDVSAETIEEAQNLIDEGDYEEFDHNHDLFGDGDKIEFDRILEEKK